MGPGEHRPYDHECWARPWSMTLFAGDLFQAIPFGDQPTVIKGAEDGPDAGEHFVGAVSFGYGPADHADLRHDRVPLAFSPRGYV